MKNRKIKKLSHMNFFGVAERTITGIRKMMPVVIYG
jgi:hypothetical protein